LLAVDAFPPATFDIEFSGWVPTLELTAYVRAPPEPGPVRILYRAQLIDARRSTSRVTSGPRRTPRRSRQPARRYPPRLSKRRIRNGAGPSTRSHPGAYLRTAT
ncbi:MAG: hypothetical protein ACRDK8_08420, partial [Solirubrobacteraceae bacterium]